MLSADDVRSIARLPSREVLYAQLVGTVAAPLTGLARGLNALIAGLAIQLQAIADQGLVSGRGSGGRPPSGRGAEAPRRARGALPSPRRRAEPEAAAAPEAPAEPEADTAAEPEAAATRI